MREKSINDGLSRIERVEFTLLCAAGLVAIFRLGYEAAMTHAEDE